MADSWWRKDRAPWARSCAEKTSKRSGSISSSARFAGSSWERVCEAAESNFQCNGWLVESREREASAVASDGDRQRFVEAKSGEVTAEGTWASSRSWHLMCAGKCTAARARCWKPSAAFRRATGRTPGSYCGGLRFVRGGTSGGGVLRYPPN